jgi:serine/threonine protein kinase
MEVMLQTESGLETKAILKLYDRRFATGLRKHTKAEPWTPATEEIYKQYVLQGRADKLFEILDEPSDDEESSDDSDSDDEEERDANLKMGQKEGFLHHYCGKIYSREVRAYETLRDLQEQMIPKFLACVRLPSCDTDIPQQFLKYFDIRGILIEYIEGFNLSELETKAPKSQWQVICDNAIDIVHLIGDHGILNNDVRPENFLVRSNPEGKYQVFQIDFSDAHHRDGLSWETWQERKYSFDEEGAIGLVMKLLLKGGIEFERSSKWLEYDE